MRWSRRAVLLAGTLAMVAGSTGCTDDPAPTGRESTSPVDGPVATRAPGLFAVNSQRLGGLIVIDAQGYAVYRNDADGASPSATACVGACAAIWSPMPAGDVGRLRIVGLDRGKVGRLVRPDGTEQLTLAGWPLYSYSGDRMPGDTNGHGVDGWFVISPTGARAGRVGT